MPAYTRIGIGRVEPPAGPSAAASVILVGLLFVAGLAVGMAAVAVHAEGAPLSMSGEQGARVPSIAELGALSMRSGPQLAPADVATAAGAGGPAALDSEAAQEVDPSKAATHVLLPVLNALGTNQACYSWLAVKNIGAEPTKAVLLVWAEPHDTGCNGALKAECTGLIRPGGAWNLTGAQIPTGTRGGILFSFTTQRLSEIGAPIEPDDVVADYMCERLFYGVVGRCDRYEEFKTAFDTGGEFLGVPMDQAVGSPLAVEVHRGCASQIQPGLAAHSTYDGLGTNRHGAFDAAFGGYRYHVAPVYPAEASQLTYLYVQNGGAEDASVEMWFQAQGECDAEVLCETTTVRPGETIQLDTAACATEVGGVWFKSSSPLGIAVDTLEGYGQATYTALPSSVTHDASGAPVLAGADQTLFGPLFFDRERGWEQNVVVQNLDLETEALVEVTFLGPAGQLVDEQSAPICAGGSEAFVLEMLDERPGSRVGSIRVESLPTGGPGSGDGVPVSAVALLSKYNDRSKAELHQTVGYNLLPGGSTQARSTAGTTAADMGSGVIAVPSLNKDLDGTGATSEVALTNLVQAPGWTDVAVLVYDSNDLVDVFCRRIGAGQTTYLNLQYAGKMAPGFLGTAFVSATQWDHTAADADDPEHNPLGLAAALVTRQGTWLGEDIPGDELGATLGTPIQSLPASVSERAGAVCSFSASPKPTPETPPSGPVPASLAAQVYVPTINFQGQDDVCESAIEVRNAGTEPAKAMLITWGEPGFCEPQSGGPLSLQCSALVAPGESWTFTGADVPTGTASGILYGITVKTMAEIGATPATDQPVADYLCEELFAEVVGNGDETRRFKLAQNAGLPFAGVPMDQAVAGPLEVAVERTCPDTSTPGATNTSRYAGISGARYDALGDSAGGYWHSVVPVYADSGGLNSVIYIQNAGTRCTEVALSFSGSGHCLYPRECSIYSLAPGEVYAFDVSNCVGPSWRGSAVLHSQEPLAVVADTIGQISGAPVQWTYSGYPTRLPYDLNADGEIGEADAMVVQAALGSTPEDPNWNARADLNGNGMVDSSDAEWLAANLCGATNPDTAEPPAGEPRRSDHVALPALQYSRDGNDCRSWFAIQNVGDEPAKAAVVFWGKPPEEGQPCAGPLSVECTGLVSPGSSWHVFGTEVPSEAKSAIAFSLSGKTVSELGLGPEDSIVADLVCDALKQGVIGNCGEYRAFKAAFDQGTDFAELAMDQVAGSAIAAQVDRVCPGDMSPSIEVSAAYRAIGANEHGRYDPALDQYVYYAPNFYARKAGFTSFLHIQNVGHETAQVELHFRALADCSASTHSGTVTIEPGDSLIFDPVTVTGDMRSVGPNWQGNAWLVSNQPLAAVVDGIGRDSLTSYNAVPAHTDFDTRGEPLEGVARSVAYGPLNFSPDDGWDSGVYVQNLHATAAAQVRVAFLDADGAVLDVVDDSVCPLGAMVYFSPVVDAREGSDLGTIRVVSQRPVWGPLTEPAPISAVAMLMQYTDAARTMVRQAVAYNMLPGFDRSTPASRALGSSTWSAASLPQGGSNVVALPGLTMLPEGAGIISDVALTNLAHRAAAGQAAVLAYDTTGMIDGACPEIGGNTAQYLRLEDFEQIPPGFRGSALVSGMALDREGLSNRSPAAGLPNLAAAALWRHGTDAAGHQPDDKLGAALGVGLQRLPSGSEPTGDPCAPPPPVIYLPIAETP